MESGGALIISAKLRADIISHARAALPREAVGLLGGNGWGRVTRALSLPNLAGGERAFIADPFAQFCALRSLEAEKLRLLAIYHSHPDGGAGLSAEDMKCARQWRCAHLIVSLPAFGSGDPKLRAYRCNAFGDVEEVTLRLSMAHRGHVPPAPSPLGRSKRM
jgi:proteasome lid subunit RPN8/RPN11